ESATIVDSVHDDRFCFAVPWYDSVVVGTTDTPYNGDLDKVEVTSEEKRYVLDALNALFPQALLTEADITGCFAGLRPLIKEPGKSTKDASRKHRLEETADGLLSIAGGKLTTYRLMAKETVDLIAAKLRKQNRARQIGPCKTERLPLGGFEHGDDMKG